MPLSTNQEKQALIDLMGKTTLEVTPSGAAKVSDFSQILRAGCTVYVTFLQGSDFRRYHGYCASTKIRRL